MRLLFIFAFLMLSSCQLFQKFEEPQVEFKNVKVINANFSTVDLGFTFEIMNPNDYEIEIKKLNYSVQLNNEPVIDNQNIEGWVLPKKQKKTFVLPASMKTGSIIGSLLKGLDSKKMEYVITGFAETSVISVPFKESGVYHVPQEVSK